MFYDHGNINTGKSTSIREEVVRQGTKTETRNTTGANLYNKRVNYIYETVEERFLNRIMAVFNSGVDSMANGHRPTQEASTPNVPT